MKKNIVVIGAGLSGLSSALSCLTHDAENINLTVLEKSNKPGGMVTTFQRNGYTIDTCQMMPDISKQLQYFNIKLNVDKISDCIGSLFIADVKNKSVEKFYIPAGIKAFNEMIMSVSGSDESKIQKFLKHSYEMYGEVSKLKIKMRIPDVIKLLITCPHIIKYSSRSFMQYVESFKIENKTFNEIMNYFCSMSGLPAENTAALLPVGIMYSLLENSYFIKPSFSDLPLKMADKIIQLDGKILYKKEVVNICIHNNRVKGVVLKSGEIIPADFVLSSIDAKNTSKMIENSSKDVRVKNSKFILKSASMEMTGSNFTVYLGLDDKIDLLSYGLKGGFQILTSGKESLLNIYKSFRNNEFMFDDENFQIGISYSFNRAEAGQVLTLSLLPVRFDYWHKLKKENLAQYKTEKEVLGCKIIKKVEEYLIPDLSKHIRMINTASPATYARYANSSSGSIYDIASTPDNFGPKRISMYTPVKGLLMPKFAHGIYGTVCGGMQAADAVFDYKILYGNARL